MKPSIGTKRIVSSVRGRIEAVEINVDRLIETRAIVLATSGAGKSWLLRRMLEQTHGAVQQIVIDVEGEFGTLREKLKVWGGLTHSADEPSANKGMQARTIVAAYSQKHAVEVIREACGCRMSLHEFSQYWSETGNATELGIATHVGVWTSGVNMVGKSDAKWRKLERKNPDGRSR